MTGTQLPDMPDDDRDTWAEFSSEDGRVTCYPPVGDPYWRVVFYYNGQRKQWSGGRFPSTAWAKMALALARLDADLEPDKMATPGHKVITHWMEPGQRRKGGKVWSAGTRAGHLYYVDTYIRPELDHLRAEQWRARHYRTIVNNAPTADEGDQVRRRLSTLVRWAAKAGYLTAEQAFALTTVTWVAPVGYVERPKRTGSTTEAGESEDRYLDPANAMDEADLAAVGDALGAFYPHGKLFVELGAETSCRQGELFAWRLEHLERARHRYRVHDQFNAKAGKLTPPKMNKRRWVTWSPKTITGYDLDAAIDARIQQIKAEQAAGRNPEGLFFPDSRGGYLNASNFDSRVWVPAMGKAGVTFVLVEDKVRSGKRKGKPVTRKLYRFTTHSLRDRFAITALNVRKLDPNDVVLLGGWKDANVLFARYYGVASRAFESIIDQLRPGMKAS